MTWVAFLEARLGPFSLPSMSNDTPNHAEDPAGKRGLRKMQGSPANQQSNQTEDSVHGGGRGCEHSCGGGARNSMIRKQSTTLPDRPARRPAGRTILGAAVLAAATNRVHHADKQRPSR